MFHGRQHRSVRKSRSRVVQHKSKQLSTRRVSQTQSRVLSFNERFEKSLNDIQHLGSRILTYTIEELEPICLELTIQQMSSIPKPPPSSEVCPLVCLFCQHLIHEPLTLCCGHTYCEQCIKDEQISGKMNCPRCPEEIQGQIQSTIVQAREYPFNRNHFLKQSFERSELLSDKHQLNILYHKGKSEYSNGNFDQAIEIYSSVLDQDPDHHLALFGRARSYLALNRLEQALSDINRVVSIKPQWSKGHLCQSEIFYQMNHYKSALLSSLKAMVINPDDTTGKTIMARHLHAVLHNDNNEQLPPSTESEPNTSFLMLQRSTTNINPSTQNTHLKLCKSNANQQNEPSSLPCFCDQLDGNVLHSRDFECSICINLLWFPITTPCGHVFCRECLIRSIDHTTIQCPICKTPIQTFFPLVLDSHVNKTELIDRIMQTYFPKEYDERKKLFEEENRISIPRSPLSESVEAPTVISEVPIFVCVLALPFCPCPLHVFEPRYRLMMRRTLETTSRNFGMCTYDAQTENFSDYGTLLHIQNLVYTPDGRSIVETIGQRRFRVLERGITDGYNTAKIELIQDNPIEQHEFDDLFTLNRVTYQRVKDWYNRLDGYRRTLITRHFEQYPQCDDLVQGSTDGPRWAWIMLNVLPINTLLQFTALASQSFRVRLQIINDVIDYLNQQQRNENDS